MADEATTRQAQASDPLASVWVTASAGSGKTKVLTDRVLRLLLAGTPPAKILCITYTKAGSAEMRSRIEKRLGQWVMMDEDRLRGEVGELVGKGENSLPKLVEAARQLFARVIEDPVGLRIQTIHSFCQSLLARFPIEAGVAPHFTLLDDMSSTRLLAEAKHKLAGGGMVDDAPELSRAIKKIARTSGEWGFDELLSALISRRKDFFAVLDSDIMETALKRVQEGIFAACNVPETMRSEDSLCAASLPAESDINGLKQLALRFAEGPKTLAARGTKIEKFLSLASPSLSDVQALASAFLTKENELPQKPFSKAFTETYPDSAAFFWQMGARMQEICRQCQAFASAERAYSAYVIAAYLYATYQNLKEKQAALDYDDLIFKARELLAGDRALAWVMFKLDGGIDHVLIDEAQDTSRAQWDITAALVDEFFAGDGRSEGKTLFVVGDPKQSIFRFQGAFPEGFAEHFNYFKEKAAAAGIEFRHVPLTTSFRSSPAILNYVDAVFSESARAGLGEYLPHAAHHGALAGRIELWPLFESDHKEKKSAWELPKIMPGMQTGARKLADAIAETIHQWLQEKRVLPATGEPIQPRDIMILSRRREPMASALIQAFREKAIPCTGLDRLALTEHIAVKDMLALGAFLLLPGDDLSLASVLKSPLYNVDEETLLRLCVKRGHETLWQRVQSYEGVEPAVFTARKELELLLNKTDFISPYALFAYLLYALGGMERMCMRLGSHVAEILEMFLAEALAYEENTTPSLEEFCHGMALNKREVKREQEEVGNEVQIFTVHGAKGLEAPIVFLVDTTSVSSIRGDDRLTSFKGIPIPLPARTEDSDLTAGLRAEQEQQIEEEYRRLFYVALTRAKHELYIAGVKPGGNRQLSPQSWYAMAGKGMDALEVGIVEGQGRIYDETGTPLHKDRREIASEAIPPLPDYMFTKPEVEIMHTVRNPSHLDEEVEETVSNSFFPMEDRQKRIDRGIVIHRLLEVLTSVQPSARLAVGKKLVAVHAPNVAAAEREDWVEKTVSLMEHPDYAELFGKDALAEVPIVGSVETGAAISGQIDRLLVKENEVQVIDFKSGNWRSGSSIPLKYKNQMRAYSSLLRQVYPTKTIRSGLLFTEGPEMVWVDEDS